MKIIIKNDFAHLFGRFHRLNLLIQTHNQMNFSFKAVSLSYKTSPIHIRESVALNENECRRLLALFKNYIPSTDILVLSTCNRTEVYYQAEQDFSSQIISLIALEKGI